MIFSEVYRNQVNLLVRTLPHVAEEDCFALKGGTAINLFVRDLPRLSVDIDLTYLPIEDRETSLIAIGDALRRIGERITTADNSIRVTESAPASQAPANKLVIRSRERVQIKVEVTPVLRGCVYQPVMMEVSEKTQAQFGFAEMNVLSFSDLFAGKIMAALDRQHPRDLFDVSQLLNNEGISDEMRTALIIYLISHDKPPHSSLAPSLKDISQDYEQNFVGMTADEVSLDTLTNARENLIEDVVNNMPQIHKDFLCSFYKREPQWDLLAIDGAQDLPAVRWREQNLDRSGSGTKEDILKKLEEVIGQ
ncbi:nucleotidyl transferase AbiEii/AbiGii toxin family protein [Porticoccaceae bacterium]|nr:nucleotidyl transferase AbiEii/AbiGii toxin family protein [Porticoccaceae bacterium]